MQRLARVIVIAVSPALLCAPALLAQTAPDPPFGTGELHSMRLPLQPVQPTPQLLTRWGMEPHWSFALFDEARFGFRAATLTLDHPSDCTDGQHALVDIIVALEGTRGVRYWRLAEPVSEAAAGFCQLDDPDRWSIIAAHDEEAAMNATRATPDAGVPIFRVTYAATFPNRTSIGNTQQLLIDARSLIPVAPARVTISAIDGFCINPPDLPQASCRWDSGRSDLLCTESFRGGKRYSWMIGGQRLPAPPGSREPATLAAFITTLLADPNAIGRWAEPADAGAVRLIAMVPSRIPGRRILLFGASASFQSPFILAVRDGNRTRVVPVPLAGSWKPLSDPALDTSVPLGEYRLSGEPPAFTVQTMVDRQGTRLLRVVSESENFRALYHVAIEDGVAQVVPGAVEVASSLKTAEDAFDALTTTDQGACAETEGNFSSPAGIQQAPLAVTYDVEPMFTRRDGRPQPDDVMCIVSSRAAWIPGTGFTLTYQSAPCPNDRFRGVFVRPDGSLDIRAYKLAP